MPLSTRENILDAAMAVVREQGVARLTLDAAARGSGISKGGVLYHFKSKDDLVRGMVARLLEQCDLLHQKHWDAEPLGPYRWARAVVKTAFDPDGPAGDRIGGALLAAAAVNPALMAPAQAKFIEWMARIKGDSPDPARAALVCMAMDGFTFERMMGLHLYDNDHLALVRQAALDLLQ